MVYGIFTSLIIGTILKTAGQELNITILENIGNISIESMGAAIGISIAYKRQLSHLILFSCACCGTAGAIAGGPLGALIASVAGMECGKYISGKTRMDLILTPAVTILAGGTAGLLSGPAITSFLSLIGNAVFSLTNAQPILSGSAIAVLMGMAMCTPLSSTAIAVMLNLHGTAAGAATVGCCCQLVGFAIGGYRDNGPSGLISLGIGCAILQLPNIIKNPYIWLPPIVASALLGPWVTTLFPMENISVGAGMGSSGLVGQLGTITCMGNSPHVWILIAIFHFLLPGLISGILTYILRYTGKIKDGDMKI